MSDVIMEIVLQTVLDYVKAQPGQVNVIVGQQKSCPDECVVDLPSLPVPCPRCGL